MPARPNAVLALLALAAVLAVLAVTWAILELGGPDPAADPALRAVVSGPLYAARTIRGDDGADDIAYLTRDATLTAIVRADPADGARGVERVLVRIDGRVRDVRVADCPDQRCPRTLVVRFMPRLVATGTGAHRIELFARAAGGSAAVRVAAFDVHVGEAGSASAEIEPRRRTPPPLALSATRLAVDRIVARSTIREPLAGLVGRSRLRLRERGVGRAIVTVLADLRPARRDVSAELPQPAGDGPVRMHARVLRDLLIDVDLRHRRLVAVQPGPDSRIDRWTTLRGAPTASGEDEARSAAFTASRPPRLHRLSDRGPAFFVEDGDPSLRRDGRDWPLSVVFSGAATVAKVKAGLRRIGLVRRGTSRYLGYRTAGSGLLRFDGDRGLKSPCDANGTDLHVRVYAPTATDRFADPGLGSVVLGTVHLDHVDGCGVGPTLFGFSERAEARLAALLASRLGWRVRRDALAVGNGEPLRRDPADPGHLWLADGAATVVSVP